MVVIKLCGGLGNQMFQYAAGRRLSYVHGVELKFDISGFKEDRLRTYELGAFNIEEKFATEAEVAGLSGRKKGLLERITSRAFRNASVAAPIKHVKEKFFHFDPEILRLPDGVYLDGYWQSEKYFKDIESVIRKELTVKTAQAGRNSELAAMIGSSASVSIHIRRGDYVSNPIANQVLGVCVLDYYYRSIEHIAQKVERPHFFVFSDEPQWAKDHLKLPYPVEFIAHNAADHAYEDLRLMSLCKHHIIANSSFSWWGAWLNPDPDKKVFAPKRWFRTDECTDIDLVPVSWIRV